MSLSDAVQDLVDAIKDLKASIRPPLERLVDGLSRVVSR